jgi:heme exporter protein C
LLLFATYQPLRFSIEDPERQARYASVFAVMAGAFVPLNFVAVRAATATVHPRTFGSADGGLPAQMAWVFVVALVAMTLLFALLCAYEIAAKQTKWRLRALRRRLLGGEAVAPLGRTAAPALAGPARRDGSTPRSARNPAEAAS